MDLFLGFEYLIDAHKRIFYVYLFSSLLISIVYLYFHPKEKRINLSSKLWLHPSAKIDYTYFFISNIIKILLIYPLVLSAKTVALFIALFLIETFGYIRLRTSYELILFLYTISIFIFSDFTRYLLHLTLHKIPFLWRFHKVHHSAKVLTPMTFYRVHPLENILFGFRYALSIGLVTGVFIYFFGARIDIYTVLGVNIFVFLFSIFGSNLRHSHIKLSYYKSLENVFISPFMHQLHHSTKYHNKNFGGYLAIWDKIFDTHQGSENIKSVKFGLNDTRNYNSVLKLFSTPFKNKGKKNVT